MTLPANPAPPSLLFVVGSDFAERVAAQAGSVRAAGSTDLAKLLGAELYHLLRVTPNLLRQAARPKLSSYRCILNLIVEPEGNAKVLAILSKLLRGAPVKVVNRPEAVLASTLEQVAKKLTGINGLVVPKVARLPAREPDVAVRAITQAGLDFPLIVRRAGTHRGNVIGLFDSVDAVRAAIEPGREHVAIEFVDFQSADGLYRKYRVYFFGAKRVLRHMLVMDEWNVHAKGGRAFMVGRPDLLAEEAALLESPTRAFPAEVERVFDAIGERMPLDLFGLDFGFDRQGRVVLFEANATMHFFPIQREAEYAYLLNCVAPAQRAMRALVGLEG